MNGVILDSDTLGITDIDLSPITTTLQNWQVYSLTEPSLINDRIQNADIVLSNKVLLQEAQIRHGKNLKLIGVMATGTNNIDITTASKLAITVCNVPSYGTHSVAQHTIALLLALTNKTHLYQQDIQNGAWQDSPMFCLLNHSTRELQGKTLAIVGYGASGQAVAKIAEAMGMIVKIAQRSGTNSNKTLDGRQRYPLTELLKNADVISLHCPLTKDTENLIDEQALRLMKKQAIVLNCARGGIVNEQALAFALKEQRIAAAGLDVLISEPPPNDHPLLNANLPNLIISPHIAWATREARQRLVNESGKNIEAFLKGLPRNVVNPLK